MPGFSEKVTPRRMEPVYQIRVLHGGDGIDRGLFAAARQGAEAEIQLGRGRGGGLGRLLQGVVEGAAFELHLLDLPLLQGGEEHVVGDLLLAGVAEGPGRAQAEDENDHAQADEQPEPQGAAGLRLLFIHRVFLPALLGAPRRFRRIFH